MVHFCYALDFLFLLFLMFAHYVCGGNILLFNQNSYIHHISHIVLKIQNTSSYSDTVTTEIN